MNWITFEVAGSGIVAVQITHIVAVYDEQGSVKLSTTAGGVHVLKEMTVQRAVGAISAAFEAAGARPQLAVDSGHSASAV